MRYYIDINVNKSDKKDGDIKNFNDGEEGYSAQFKLHAIDSGNGSVINKVQLREVTTSSIKNFHIPESTYYWSSYMQIVSGDYDDDGLDEVAVVVPGKDNNTGNLYIYGMENRIFVKEYE